MVLGVGRVLRVVPMVVVACGLTFGIRVTLVVLVVCSPPSELKRPIKVPWCNLFSLGMLLSSDLITAMSWCLWRRATVKWRVLLWVCRSRNSFLSVCGRTSGNLLFGSYILLSCPVRLTSGMLVTLRVVRVLEVVVIRGVLLLIMISDGPQVNPCVMLAAVLIRMVLLFARDVRLLRQWWNW